MSIALGGVSMEVGHGPRPRGGPSPVGAPRVPLPGGAFRVPLLAGTLGIALLAGVLGAALLTWLDIGSPSPVRALYLLRPPDPAPYTLDTVSAAMTAAVCAADARCVDATASGAVADDDGDDQAPLSAALAKVAASQGTVFLPPGRYLLRRPLYLPTGVRLAGAGLTRTTLLLSWRDLGNFAHNYLIAPAGGTATDAAVADLTVDGGRRRAECADGAYTGSCQPDQGGGVKAGSGWTVRRVRFTGLNYFKLWICGVSRVRVLDGRWDNLGDGVGAGGEDNIGGGCGASDITLAGNSFHESIVGNVIDLTRARFVTVSGNRSEKNSIFLEGVTDSSIIDSVVVRGDINIIANGRYQASVEHGNFNPARVTIARNTLQGGTWGINIGYFNRDGAVNHPGGANIVTGNAIERADRLGIVVTSCDRGAKNAADIIWRNVITDVNAAGAGSYNAGCASFDPAGIGLGAGSGDRIGDNRIVDTRTPPRTAYGIEFGIASGDSPPSDTVLSGNVAVGVRIAAVHDRAR